MSVSLYREKKIIEDEFDGLKPCPFCGSTKVTLIRPVSLTGEFVFAVNCVNCETGINHNGIEFYDSWREAAKAWNRRTNNGTKRD